METTPESLEFATHDAYILQQPEKNRVLLQRLRQLIKNAAPGAREIISYKMPAFKLNGILAWYAGHKNHVGLYVKANAMVVFREQLLPFKTSKGAIRFGINDPLPEALISEIIAFRLKENAGAKPGETAKKGVGK